MTNAKAPLKFIGLLVLVTFLATFTGLFAAIPMRTLRRVYGRLPFWLSSVAMSAAFFVGHQAITGVFLLLLTLMVGVYAEVEEHGETVFTSGLVAMMTSIGLTAVGVTFFLMRSGTSLVVEMKSFIASAVADAAAISPDTVVDQEALIRTMPASIAIALIVAIGTMLIWDSALASLFRLPRAGEKVADQLRAFHIPDVFVWITTVSIFAAYYKHGNVLAETIGLNVFYSMIALFFFQGVAVMAQGFRTFKVGPFWQTIWVVMMIIQFYAVAFLGFADFWIDFRSRLQRRPAPTKNSF